LDLIDLVTELCSTPVNPISMLDKLCLSTEDYIEIALDARAENTSWLVPIIGP